MDILIEWPKRLRPLPPGYTVWYIDSIEHYIGISPDEHESPITVSKFWARRWCFAHYEKQQEKQVKTKT